MKNNCTHHCPLYYIKLRNKIIYICLFITIQIKAKKHITIIHRIKISSWLNHNNNNSSSLFKDYLGIINSGIFIGITHNMINKGVE